jgi:ketosteroid isomerase-like protein
VSPHEELVRRMWAAYARRGLEAILDFAAPDAEWRPYSAGGRVFADTESYRAHVAEQQLRGEFVDATLIGVEELDQDTVVVSGRLRLRLEGSLDDSPMFWLHRFRGDQIVFTASSPRREDLLA